MSSRLSTIVNKFLLLSISIVFFSFLFTAEANAGTIVNAPKGFGLSNGLVGYWTFDGKDMAGDISYDKSGQGNNGTLTNGPVRAIGKLGQALSFDGSDDLVSIGTPSVLNDMGDISISAWIKPRRMVAETFGGRVVGKRSALGWILAVRNTNAIFFYMDFDSGLNPVRRDTSNNTITPNVWQHVVMTRVAGGALFSNIHIYVNGVEPSYQTETNGSGARDSDSAIPLQIGEASADNDANFDGLIDDVRIYNRVLSPDEIKRLYKIGATAKFGVAANNNSLTQGLVGYWTFDGKDMAGNISYDKSGQGNNGTLTNGPTRAIGKLGQALNFDGVDDFVNIGNPSSLNISGNITVSAWIRFSVSQNNRPIVARWGTDQSYLLNVSHLTNNRLIFCIRVADVNKCAESATTYNDNTWHYVVGRFNGSNVLLTIDNGAENIIGDATSGPIDTPATDVVIGTYNNGPPFFSGSLDDVRVYNRVLSPDEIKRLYKIGATAKFGVAANNNTLTQGLVGYWTFDGKDMAGDKNSTSARTIYDNSGQNNKGLYWNATNTPAAVGKLGQALSFDGVDDTVNVNDATSLRPSSAMTISAWIKKNATGVNHGIVSKHLATGDWESYRLAPRSTDVLRFTIQNDTHGGFPFWDGDTILSANRWYHVVGVLKGITGAASDVNLYVDGVQQAVTFTANLYDSSFTLKYSSDPVVLGAIAQDVTAFYMNGSIDDVRIYNRALSSDEVKRLYNIGR